MLWLYQRIFFNPVNAKVVGLQELKLREITALVPLVILVFWIGLYPNSLLSFMHVSVAHLLDQVHGTAALVEPAKQVAGVIVN